jgi:hypothetical protein
MKQNCRQPGLPIALGWALVCTLVIPAALGAAPPPPPSTGSTSAPATTSPAVPNADQTTPRGALRLLSEAMDAGEGAKMRQVLQGVSPDEQKMIDALVSYREAIAKFGKSAVTAFGAEDAKKLTGDTIARQSESLTALANLPEKVDGDHAVVGPDTEPQEQIHLERVNGQWKVLVGKLIGQVQPAEAKRVLDDMAARTRVFNDTSRELDDNRYKSPEEAGQALQMKMMRLTLDAPGPGGAGAGAGAGAGGPTSAPSASPAGARGPAGPQ